ncbi:MAG: TIGR03560 family F420-dependent LLM class oxidoreductase [Chloroflexi bacterium]|nr:TIGR03560 family F420-dependent LLM class oxidoreductase [Chloroflexota bacterium]
MLKVSINVEGQMGLTWPRWKQIVESVEELGFDGLFRSDHFTNKQPPDMDSLDLWVSLVWLADHTQRIHFGSLVSPVSFRHPVMTARMASAVDDLSNGRLILGLGAGWMEREHRNFGWDLLDLNQRFSRFKEALEVIGSLLQSEVPSEFEGEYYHLRDAILLPRPNRPGGPPILIGGNGQRRTFPLVVKYASYWNAVFTTPAEYARLNHVLDEQMLAAGRDPAEVTRTLMTTCFFGENEKRLNERLRPFGQSAEELRQRGLVAGYPKDVIDQLVEYARAGVQEIMLQWLYLDDMDSLLDGLAALSRYVLSPFRNQ